MDEIDSARRLQRRCKAALEEARARRRAYHRAVRRLHRSGSSTEEIAGGIGAGPDQIRSILRAPHRVAIRRRVAAATLASLLLLTIGAAAARNSTFVRDVAYGPCHVDYGRPVAEWEGTGSRGWNERGYHYVARLFSLEASAPPGIFANVRERPPTRIATSLPSRSGGGCLGRFDGLIDPAARRYAWNGSPPVAVRLGEPDLGAANHGGRATIAEPPEDPDRSLTPPVYGRGGGRAAAWVDDGGEAVVQNQDLSTTRALWCQGDTTLLPVTGCRDLAGETQGGSAVRGDGYLFVGDDCPPTADCSRATAWYAGALGAHGEDFSDLVGRDAAGALRPFHLYLAAVSTYAPTIGAWTIMTFKYPAVSTISATLAFDSNRPRSGDQVIATLALEHAGPSLKGVSLSPILSGQPLSQTSPFRLTPAGLTALNQGETVRLIGRFAVGPARTGACYDMRVDVRPQPAANRPTAARATSFARARYCIAPPPAIVYTFSVTRKGNVPAAEERQVREQAPEVLNDPRGWSRAGIAFREVSHGGDFTIVLAAADQMTSFSDVCDSLYSCTVGNFVIINETRWREGTPAWMRAGGSLTEYREMVMDHETGHWLGFDHTTCPGPGRPAPVMMQESKGLHGCAVNSWPTPPEVAQLRDRLGLG